MPSDTEVVVVVVVVVVCVCVCAYVSHFFSGCLSLGRALARARACSLSVAPVAAADFAIFCSTRLWQCGPGTDL